MRYTVLIALLLAAPLFAAVPQQVPFIATHGQQPREWYLEQAQLWRAETEKDPANANAWRNYYMATEYGQRGGTTDKSARAAILAKMQVHVADSYEYAYLQQRHYDGDDLDTKRDLMEEAYARCNSCGEIIENLAYHSEITGQHERARGLWAKLYQTRRIAPGLFDYNYNMLQSTLPDAILFTNGDNDTFPALTLQQSQEIRPDVLVLNLYTIQRQRDLLARALAARDIAIKTVDLPKTDAAFVAALAQRLTAAAPDVPLYFALSVSAAYKEQINDRLYIEGLASRYSAVGVDNLARLQYNLEHRFRIDYLTHAWYGQFHPTTEVNRLNTNYAFPFILLAEHYQQSGEDTRAHRWRERALDIARPYPYLIKELENRAIK